MSVRLAGRRVQWRGYVLLFLAASIGAVKAAADPTTQPGPLLPHSDPSVHHGRRAATVAATAAGHNQGDAAAGGGGGGGGDDESAGVLRLLQAAKQYRARVGGGTQMLRHRDVNRALYMGDQERIRSFVRRMADGQNLTIAILGGSVSKGMGAVCGEPSYEQWLATWLAAVAPAPAAPPPPPPTPAGSGEEEAGAEEAGGWRNSMVRVLNAACPATSSAYMNMCLREYLRDTDVDLVLVEYAINDEPFADPHLINEPRKSMEQLIRKLLRLPKRPAVVLLNVFRWFSQNVVGPQRLPTDTLYFTNAEPQFFEFATYYGLPLISVKAATYHHMAAGTRGFQVDTFRYLTRPNTSSDPEALFYEDPMHPSGLTGHRAISELVVGLLLHVARGLVARPWRQSEEELVVAPLPGHMIPGNFDSQLDMCILGDNLRATAVEAQGFEWLNEGRNPIAPKWGYTATQPNSTVVFAISTPAGAGAGAAAVEAVGQAAPALDIASAVLAAAAANSSVLLILAYLRSYKDMGVAAISCEGGCVCGDGGGGQGAVVEAWDGAEHVIARLDGLWEHSNSQLQLGCFPARVTGPVCRVRVRVEDAGRNGTNKVKLGGIIVSHTAPGLAGGMCRENLEAAERAAGYREDRRRV